MFSNTTDRPWFALQVRCGMEHTTAYLLRSKGYEEFLPTYTKTSASKSVDAPLFPGYVFCRFDPGIRSPIVTTPGVIRVLGLGKTPAAVADAEIEALRTIAVSELPAKPHAYFSEGQRVRVTRGPLDGVAGNIVTTGAGGQLVVSVTLLQRSVAVEIDPRWLEPADSWGACSGDTAMAAVCV